jgi:transcriptional regulator with XRE-family HTH domain
MDVGATLQSAREGRGLSLDELANRTKINVRLLRALESNNLEALPNGIFMRGYLRAYAREVGLDPDALVESYVAQFEPVGAAAKSSQQRADDAPPDDLVVVNGYGTFDPSAETGSEAGKAIAIALVSLAFVAYLSLGTSRDPVVPELTPPADAIPAAVHDDGIPVASRGNGDGAAVVPASNVSVPVATAGNTLQIEIHPTGPCWVEATVEGEKRVYRLMNAGERETLTVQGDLMLKVGDPSAFAFSINGRPGRLSGRPGQTLSVRIGPANVSEFLSS